MTNKTELGNCYEANFLKFIEIAGKRDRRDRYRLVHAEVRGQGAVEGEQFGHAFILDILDDIVLDFSNGERLCMSFSAYDRAGKISEIGNEHAYTYDEALENAFETTIYGPWDLETSTGL